MENCARLMLSRNKVDVIYEDGCFYNVERNVIVITNSFINSFSVLSDDRSKASSKTIPQHSAI